MHKMSDVLSLAKMVSTLSEGNLQALQESAIH